MNDRPTSRREFLGSAAALGGIAFVGCDMLAGRHVHAQPRRRETLVAGKRARVIDVHAHCAVPEAMGLMGLKLGGPTARPDLSMVNALSERIAARLSDAEKVSILGGTAAKLLGFNG